MPLALFDLDDTLIDGNSPSLWSAYLADLGWVDRDSFLPREQALVAAYAEQQVSLEGYLQFGLQPLIGRTPEEVAHVAGPFVEDVIEPLIHSAAMRAIATHRQQGDRVVVISATPTFLVEAIAERLRITDVLGTALAVQHGHYSGALSGTPCAREGKIVCLKAWAQAEDESLEGAYFYSDSCNDLPLLAHVAHPRAVNPDARLRAHAKQHGWTILDWQ
ncbi:HAD family hydrolase [Pseudomonas sp. NW5]|uniref:HAD family hydrolase n=1 Tax=Pseudomonas sp. NW5 TaxID=2934934 RepID=UPI0020223D31|nr:HAD family hydrolase [Pseudomonas sp. NW5]MCL7462869.1 HAD-IB family hydrolase [Pseudomonas sp. NW5]